MGMDSFKELQATCRSCLGMNRAIIAIASSLLAIPASAQTAVVPSVGCGTGCAVAIKQLATPEQLNDQWVAVKVQTTLTIVDMDGKPVKEWRSGKLPQVWTGYKFANCRQGLYAESETSEVPVNGIRNVLTLKGHKKTASVAGSIYRQWDALCNAIK